MASQSAFFGNKKPAPPVVKKQAPIPVPPKKIHKEDKKVQPKAVEIEEKLLVESDNDYDEYVIEDGLVAAVEAAAEELRAAGFSAKRMSDDSHKQVEEATNAAQARLEAYRAKVVAREKLKAKQRAARIKKLEEKLANQPNVKLAEGLFSDNQMLSKEFRERHNSLRKKDEADKVWREEAQKKSSKVEGYQKARASMHNDLVGKANASLTAKQDAFDAAKEKAKTDKALKKVEDQRKKEEMEKRKAERVAQGNE